MGLIGENGAGKTTTIKGILQLIHTEGDIKVFDQDIRKHEKLCKEDIGVVFSDCTFPETMTCVSIHKMMKNVYKNWEKEKFFGYCEQFHLPLNKRNKEFSRGMKMKLLIACALSHQAKLLILDEATSGLDPVVRDEILDVFMEFIQDEEHSILLSSHITSDIEKVADYVTFLHEGEIILSEEKDVILEDYAIWKLSEDDFKKLDKSDYLGLKSSLYTKEVLIKNRNEMKKRFPQAIMDRASLEDILLFMVKGEKQA